MIPIPGGSRPEDGHKAAIQVEALEKRYGDAPALRGVDFSVATGEIAAVRFGVAPVARA